MSREGQVLEYSATHLWGSDAFDGGQLYITMRTYGLRDHENSLGNLQAWSKLHSKSALCGRGKVKSNFSVPSCSWALRAKTYQVWYYRAHPRKISNEALIYGCLITLCSSAHWRFTSILFAFGNRGRISNCSTWASWAHDLCGCHRPRNMSRVIRNCSNSKTRKGA